MRSPQQAQQETDEKQLFEVHAVLGRWKHQACSHGRRAKRLAGAIKRATIGTKDTQTNTGSLSRSVVTPCFFTRCFGAKEA